MRTLIAALCSLACLVVTTPATASAPALRISAAHAPSHFLPGMVAAYTEVTVTNAGRAPARGPVMVTEVLPPGLTLTAAGGEGWTCSGTMCSRSDPLAPRAAYPSIRFVVDVAGDVPPVLTNTVQLSTPASSTPRGPTGARCSTSSGTPSHSRPTRSS